MNDKYFRAADGAMLAYHDAGDGVPILALAGLTRDGRDYHYLARHLKGVRLIRLDSRGRGKSDWTGAETYTLAQETADAIGLLDHLGLDRVAVIGMSRGGLIAMSMAATAPERLSGICLVDVGPVLERAGLERIGMFIGLPPTVSTLEDAADRLALAMPGFRNVDPARWADEAVHHYVQHSGSLGLTYDPALRDAFNVAMQANPLPEAWPLFDACSGLPLALIRGAGSDILSRATADEMSRRRPDMIRVDIPDRGHVPFLDEPQSLQVIARWRDQLRVPEPVSSGHSLV